MTEQQSLLGRRILLVEDDYFIAFDLRKELTRHGADVIGPTGDLDQACAIAKSEGRIDAAVIDLNLHGEFAFNLADELIRRDVPIVFSTGYDADVLPYRLRHVERYMKPVTPRKIAEGVASLISQDDP